MFPYYFPDVPHPRQIIHATALLLSFHLIQSSLLCPEYHLCPAAMPHHHLDDTDDPREPAPPEARGVTPYHVTGSMVQPWVGDSW